MALTYRERKKILSDIEGLYSDFDNEKSYRARKKILAQIEELYLVFDGKKSATKNDDKALLALENLKALLLNPNATEEDYKALLPDVEYIEEHEEEVEETDLYKEVIKLLDSGLVAMDNISLFDAVEG